MILSLSTGKYSVSLIKEHSPHALPPISATMWYGLLMYVLYLSLWVDNACKKCSLLDSVCVQYWCKACIMRKMSLKIYKKYPVSTVSCKSIMYRIVEKFKTTDSVLKKKKIWYTLISEKLDDNCASFETNLRHSLHWLALQGGCHNPQFTRQ